LSATYLSAWLFAWIGRWPGSSPWPRGSNRCSRTLLDQPLGSVGNKAEPYWRAGLTMPEAEDWLDWLENNTWEEFAVDWDEAAGFTIRRANGRN
jgi:hypothetical protein